MDLVISILYKQINFSIIHTTRHVFEITTTRQCAQRNQHNSPMCSAEPAQPDNVLSGTSTIRQCAQRNQHNPTMCSAEPAQSAHVLSGTSTIRPHRRRAHVSHFDAHSITTNDRNNNSLGYYKQAEQRHIGCYTYEVQCIVTRCYQGLAGAT